MKLHVFSTLPRILACFCVAVALLFAASCEQLQNGIGWNDDDDLGVSVTPDDYVAPDALTGDVVITDADGNWGTDDYVLNAAAITGDRLALNVSHAGGCETHQFTLVTSGVFSESSPVQLAITVAHNANNDPCEAYLTSDYHFDLTAIKSLYQATYQSTGSLVLLLDNAPTGQLTYEIAN